MLVELKNIVFSYTGVPVLSDVSLRLHENERVGLIGGNGEGKTTLIGVVTGRLAADSGERFVKSGIGIGLLEQTGGLESSSTVYAEMERVFERDRALIEKLREVERSMSTADETELRVLAAKAESLHRQIEARDSYHFDVRIKTVLNGMGFGGQYDQTVSTMSGGEKTRLKLCRLLLEAPDLLILDEPTNHLDVKTLFWLEDYLNAYKGCLLVVSHDRYFLDRLTSRTIELERGKLWSYKGNYSKYKQLKAERLAVEQKEYEKQREEIAKLQDYVDRNLVRATTAKSAQSRVKQLEKIQPLDKPLPPPPPPGFSFPYAERPGERVLFCDSFTLT
ncbi:MAG: ABC-F family ATP-binding cassette domain-containing protein, partial [Candidatus Gallimonas sp.]